MAMKLVHGLTQGTELARRFATDRFGHYGPAPLAAHAELINSRDGLYQRFLAGELQATDFDGHVVDIDDMAEYGGEVRYLDLAHDGLVDSFVLQGDIAYYALGARVIVRWVEESGRGRNYVEVWADLDDTDRPVVTDPAPRAEQHIRLGRWLGDT
ncbi:hypothetical protein [Streptacidiphilus sp. EB129]|uniref:hypothetical protein n=1 Tax=Streptacidiphilus sp. EB129 TaxID=3156262 RepID=UPI0035164179